ncbi:MAG TPA: hypothetical protein PKA88_26350, partial [Polyangiaceae bacterium]|nr:hypothetical protein [Polyangiaceae bacterium]
TVKAALGRRAGIAHAEALLLKFARAEQERAQRTQSEMAHLDAWALFSLAGDHELLGERCEVEAY